MVTELRAVWTVPGGGTGYTIWHTSAGSLTSGAATAWAAAIRSFYTAQGAYIPNDVQISFESEVRELNTSTGALVGVTSMTPPASYSGTNAASWAGAAGYRVNWTTGVVLGGRRIIGRTYMVPAASAYDNDGTLLAAAITTAQGAGTALIGAAAANATPLAVWSRANGAAPNVTGAAVNDKTAILRSRRD